MSGPMSAPRRSLARTSVLAAVVLLAASCGDDSGDDATATGAESGDTGPTIDESLIGEVQTFDVGAMDGCELGDDGVDHCIHVEEIVDYEQTPPVGGAHAHFPQTCRFWDEPLYNEPAVHSLEHGAVWITYDPDLPEDQLGIIRDMAEHPQVMASPWVDSGHPTPVVLSAWGR
jgi:hypothetical protein